MGRPLVSSILNIGDRSFENDVECRRAILRELDLHGGSPNKVARAFGVPKLSIQRWIDRMGLRGEARKARDRWSRMFKLGGNDEGE